MRRCDICNGDDIAILFDNLFFSSDVEGEEREWKYRLLKCRSCGLGFVDPKPSFRRLCSFYEGGYACYTPSGTDLIGHKGLMKYWAVKCRYATYLGKRGLREIMQTGLGLAAEWLTGRTVSFSLGIPLHLHRDAKMFELGYGSGQWLLSMSRLGYQNLSGYDIDCNTDNASRLLSAGIAVSGGDFLENEYEEGSFDCIRMEHVIEHLPWPKEVLAKCLKMLKPGGILVLNFPCIDSWLCTPLSLRHFPALELPRHLYHHTPRSARSLFGSAGFDVVQVRPCAVLIFVAMCLNGVLNDYGLRFPSFLLLPFAPFYKLFCSLTNKGEYLTMLCRKRMPSQRQSACSVD